MDKLGKILGIANTVAIAVVLGLFAYTKLVYKRPAITESKERAKLATKKPELHDNGKKVVLVLDPITANLDPYTDPTDNKQKVHYVSMTLAVEIRDESDVNKFKDAEPVVMDKVLSNLGKKKFEDLNQVQGRYVFRSQIIDAANEYLNAPVVTEVYFNDFLLQ
ncbi:MAG: flagellar basal body-associated FliL family protein [Bdellovibrionales bacterium]|nr:flagellar basal body-associated FliL family protein [Bdellovibrionales bacterium]